LLEKTREQGFILGEGDNTIADVAWLEHVELLAQAAARTAVVAHRDYRAEFADDDFPGCSRGRHRGKTLPGRDMMLKAFQ